METLTKQEKEGLMQIFDIALKGSGVAIINNVNYFIAKLINEGKVPELPKKEEEKKEK